MYYIKISKLIIDEEKTFQLFEKVKCTGKEYKGTGLLVVRDSYTKPQYLIDIDKQVNPTYFKDSYFVASKGQKPHTDDGRTACITFLINDPDNRPTKFENKHELFYDGCYLINTKVTHSCSFSDQQRVLYQIELDDHYDFSYYKNRVLDGKLFNI